MIKAIIKVLKMFLLIVCAGSLILGGSYYYKLYKEEDQISQLRSRQFWNQAQYSNQDNLVTTFNTTINSSPTILNKYRDFKMENSDLFGWVRIVDTKINYPVMQTIDDPLFYKHNDWNKEKAIMGLPMADARCTYNSDNITIYAHNMEDGLMFGSLKKYKDLKYYLKHPVICFDTLYEKGEYDIIGVFLSKVHYNELPNSSEFLFYNYIDMNEDEFNTYVSNVKRLSLYNTGESAVYGDKLLTLSTCNYHTKDGRFVVVARKRK